MRILVFLLLLGALLGYGYIQKESILAHMLSKRLSCDIFIQRVQFTSKQLLIKDIKIKNPRGSHLPYALEGGTLQIEASPFELLKGIVTIDRVILEDATLKLELKDPTGADNNWAKLLRKFSQRQDGKGFIIETLIVSNLNFHGTHSANKSIDLPTLPYLKLENLGTQTPLALGPLSRILFQSILSTLTTKPHLGKLLDHVVLPSPLPNKSQPLAPKRDKNLVLRESAEMLRRHKLYL